MFLGSSLSWTHDLGRNFLRAYEMDSDILVIVKGTRFTLPSDAS